MLAHFCSKIASRYVSAMILWVLLALFISLPEVNDSTAQATTTLFSPLVMRRAANGYGTVTGRLVNDVGEPLFQGQVCYGGSLCAQLVEDGTYTLSGVPSGLQELEASAGDLYFSDRQSVTVAKDGVASQDFALALRILSGVRAVLTWDSTPLWGEPPNSTPNNLDIHLWVPVEPPTNTLHLFWGEFGECETFPFACVEYETKDNGFGPNTVNISDYLIGTYALGVLNDAALNPPPGVPVPSITELNATVRLYDATGLLETYSVPTTGDGIWWYVLDIDTVTNKIIPRNLITYDIPRPWARNSSGWSNSIDLNIPAQP